MLKRFSRSVFEPQAFQGIGVMGHNPTPHSGPFLSAGTVHGDLGIAHQILRPGCRAGAGSNSAACRMTISCWSLENGRPIGLHALGDAKCLTGSWQVVEQNGETHHREAG